MKQEMEEIVKELYNTVKWLTDADKQSLWYAEYLDKVNEDLKKILKENS